MIFLFERFFMSITHFRLGFAFLVFLTACSGEGATGVDDSVEISGKSTKHSAKISTRSKSSRKHFAVSYTTQVTDISATTRVLDLWIPLPEKNNIQVVKNVKVNCGEYKGEIHRDAEHGNRMVYLHILRPPSTIEAKVTFDIYYKEEATNEKEVTFSSRENVYLIPRQRDGVLKSFVIPYAESDGNKHSKVSKNITYSKN